MKNNRVVCVLLAVGFLAVSLGANAQNPTIAISISGPVNNQQSPGGTNSETPYYFGTQTLNLSCPASGTTAVVSSTTDGSGKILVDNYLNLTNLSFEDSSPVNLCGGGASCFDSSYSGGFAQTNFASSTASHNPDTFPDSVKIAPIDITGYFGEGFAGGPLSLQFDLVDYGGLFGSTTLYLVTNCAQNSNTPAPQSAPVMTGQTTNIPFNNDAFNYSAQLNSGATTTATVNPILMDQAECDAIIQASFPGAHCFVYQNAGGTGTDQAVLLELTCPQLSANGDCTPFDAELGSNFDIVLTENPGFTPNPGNPYPGWLKGHGPDTAHPCTQNPSNSPALFQSNQIDSFVFTRVDPFTKGGSGGTGSCWVATYNTPDEAPSVSVTAPVNGGTYQLGENDLSTKANYTCTPVHSTGAAGPYLTTTSCSAIDFPPGGSVPPGAQFDTSILGPHTFTATVVDSATDSATTPSPVTYNVVAPAADAAIAELGPLTVRTGTGNKLTYTIGVGDLSPTNNAYNVAITDTAPTGTTVTSVSGNREVCAIVNRRLSCTVTALSCTHSSASANCSVGTINPVSLSSLNGATMTVTVQLTNQASVGVGKTIKNVVTVSSANDPNSGNNSANWNTLVTR